MSKPPSLKDVAMAAEVDPSTASFVINGKGDKLRINRNTQARILAAASQLGYQSPFRRLSDGPSQSENAVSDNRQIGLVLSLTSPIESLALIPSLEPTLFVAGYQLEVVSLPANPTDAKARLLNTGFAGLICCRTIYSAVSAIVAGNCPTIVLWEGAGKAILAALAPTRTPISEPLPSGKDGSAGTPRPTEIPEVPQGRAKPPAEPEILKGTNIVPVTPTSPLPKPEPITRPGPIPASEPVSPPIRQPIINPKPVIATETILTPEPIATEDHAADTAATTEINPILVVTEEESAAPVVTGVSPVESSDQNKIPEPLPVSVDTEPAEQPSLPVTGEDHAADTAATTESRSIPVVSEDECAAPVVTVPALSLPKGVSPVESRDQHSTPETPEPAPVPVTIPEPAPVSVEEPSPVMSEPEPTLEPVADPIEPEPVTLEEPAADTAATTEINPIPVVAEEERAPVVTGVSPVESSEPEPSPEPVVVASAPSPEPETPPPAPVTLVEPPPIILAPAPIEVAPPSESPVAEELPADPPPTSEESPIDPDPPASETESQATDPATDQEPKLQ